MKTTFRAMAIFPLVILSALAVFIFLGILAILPSLEKKSEVRNESYLPFSQILFEQDLKFEQERYESKLKALSQELPERSETIEAGSQAVVPEWTWVTPASPYDNPAVSGQSGYGYQCGIEFGGTVTVKSVRANKLLVEYTSVGNKEQGGTRCSSGTNFIVSKSKFAAMTEQYVVIRDTLLAKKELVKQLLEQRHYGKKTKVTDAAWVEVANSDLIIQRSSTSVRFLAYGDICIIDTNGTVQVRGEKEDRTLYEYSTANKAEGTECPSGIVFFRQD